MATKICSDCNNPFHAHRGMRKRCHPCAMAQARKIAPIGNIVHTALRQGKLIRQPCEICGAIKVDAHHDDYSRPLNVRWLCRSHHRLHHNAEHRALAQHSAEP